MKLLNTRIKRAVAVAAALAAAGAGSYLGVDLTSGSVSVTLPYTAPDGNVITSYCSSTSPEYLIHSGGAAITVTPGTDTYTVNATSTPGLVYDDPYVNAGFNTGDWSGSCNSSAHGAYKSYDVPVQNGRQGNPVASIHTVTGTAPSHYFYGDTGYDLWFTPSPADNTYADMEGAGPFGVATEIMIWTSNTGLVLDSTSAQYYPVVIGGLRWHVEIGLAENGHGRCSERPEGVSPLTAAAAGTGSAACPGEGKGWNVVNFIAPNDHVGNVTVTGLLLNPFVSYVISHGWVPAGYYWEAVNAGMEITDGNARLTGFTLTGMS